MVDFRELGVMVCADTRDSGKEIQGLFPIPSHCSGITAATNSGTAHLETKSVPRARGKMVAVQRCGPAASGGKVQTPLGGKIQALILLRLKELSPAPSTTKPVQTGSWPTAHPCPLRAIPLCTF